ncbi:MAG: ATP-binding protein [Candidatus Omnitrophota bacterium]
MSFIFYAPLIFLGIAALAVAVVILSNYLSRMSFQAGAANTESLRDGATPAGEVITDKEMKDTIFATIEKTLGAEPRGKAMAETISRIFINETQKRVELKGRELADQYNVVIRQKERSEQAAWQKYNNVLVAKKETEAVIRSIAQGLVVVDAAGNVIMMNPTAEKLLGVLQKDKVGKPILENLKKEHLISMSTNPAGEENSEIEITSPEDETKRILRSSSAIIENENGQTVGMVSVLSDVTKQKELDQLKSDFVSKVSHELRTPIITVQNAVALLLGGSLGDITKEQENFLSIAKRSLQRLSLLVNDLLDEAKLEASKLELQVARYSVEKLVNDACDGLSAWAIAKAIRIEKRIHRDMPDINLDYNRMIQVINNIIGNAIKFTPRQGVITIEAGFDNDGKNLIVSVSDTGAGIDEKDLGKIFDKFYQVKGERAHTDISGTGLGLSIAREIILLHKGKIWAESGKDGGAKFSFTLPISPP